MNRPFILFPFEHRKRSIRAWIAIEQGRWLSSDRAAPVTLPRISFIESWQPAGVRFVSFTSEETQNVETRSKGKRGGSTNGRRRNASRPKVRARPGGRHADGASDHAGKHGMRARGVR
jgi:hypothetical protein